MSRIPEWSYWFTPPEEFGINYTRIHYAQLVEYHSADVFKDFGTEQLWRFRVASKNHCAIISKPYSTQELAKADFERFWNILQDFKVQHVNRCDRLSGRTYGVGWWMRLKIELAAAKAWFKTTKMYQDWKAYQ